MSKLNELLEDVKAVTAFANASPKISTTVLPLTATGVWTEMISISGSGYLTGINVAGENQPVSAVDIRIYINGVKLGGDIVLGGKSSNSAAPAWTNHNYVGLFRFTSSLRIEMRMSTYYPPNTQISVSYMLS